MFSCTRQRAGVGRPSVAFDTTCRRMTAAEGVDVEANLHPTFRQECCCIQDLEGVIYEPLRVVMRLSLVLLPVMLFMASCKSSEQTHVPILQMGVVELAEGVPSDRFSLGSGESLVITAKIRTNDQLDLQVDYDRPEGAKMKRLASRRVRAISGAPTVVSFAPYFRFTLTPKIKK